MKQISQYTSERAVITPEGAERRVLSYGGGMMAVEFRFPAGVHAPIHSHPHEQIGYVVSGELDLLLDDRSTRLGPGDSYYIAPNQRHGVVTLTPCVLLDCFTPLREEFLGLERLGPPKIAAFATRRPAIRYASSPALAIMFTCILLITPSIAAATVLCFCRIGRQQNARPRI
ncbi:cupin domain-containing protein [Candidatus Gracilibacteria bacterium]|nr:cupin domain-containing protein [Candidatus Gracilibacteria bacterium]